MRGYRTTFALALVVCSALHAAESVLNASVVGVDDEYANIRTSISAADWDRFNVSVGTPMTIDLKDVHVEATFVETYTEVSEGSWLALVDDDHLKIAISFGHACEIMDCAIGDRLTITVRRSQDSVQAD